MRKAKRTKVVVSPKELEHFVGESEYGGKGGQTHAGPTGPMKGNPVYFPKQVGVKPTPDLKKKLEKDAFDITDETVAQSAEEDEKQ